MSHIILCDGHVWATISCIVIIIFSYWMSKSDSLWGLWCVPCIGNKYIERNSLYQTLGIDLWFKNARHNIKKQEKNKL